MKPKQRSAPRDCQQEPPYPGLETECVVHALRSPNLTAHLPSAACKNEMPHPVAECGHYAEVLDGSGGWQGEDGG